jgi:hypothetical protein
MDPMSPFQWLREVGEALPATAITVLDGNVVSPPPSDVAGARAGHAHDRATNGCISTGILFGAKLARPELPVVAVCGDFGFGPSGIELRRRSATRCRSWRSSRTTADRAERPQRQFFAGLRRAGRKHYGDGVRHDLIMNASGRGIRVQRPGEMGHAQLGALLRWVRPASTSSPTKCSVSVMRRTDPVTRLTQPGVRRRRTDCISPGTTATPENAARLLELVSRARRRDVRDRPNPDPRACPGCPMRRKRCVPRPVTGPSGVYNVAMSATAVPGSAR